MLSIKMTITGSVEIKVSWNKSYDVIICLDGVINKVLSDNLNHIVEMVMWPKFVNSSISIREGINHPE